MKKGILLMAIIAMANAAIAGNGKNFWSSAATKRTNSIVNTNKESLTSYKLFELDVNGLKSELSNLTESVNQSSNVVVSFPDADGNFAEYRIVENSNMDPALAARYPEIKSYKGIGITDPTSVIYFSVSPLGVQTMQVNANRSAVFIEPYTTDQSSYAVYRKEDKVKSLNYFECRLIANANEMMQANNSVLRPNADDGTRRTYRLAMSVTGEYTAYFGGTKALALAAINNTMTRVNGVFEIDFNVHMNLIANTDVVIYTSASSDPYSNASAGSGGAWNQELQTTLTNNIGNASYDIGHLFGASGGGGNAGCIGCVCVNPTAGVPLGKGSGFTSPADGIPSGDNFDIDYVAHEMGHQFGANHTFTYSNEGTGVQMEPGSGSTIMGYAGITGSTDVQPHSDAYFHAISVQQVTNYIKTTSCQTNTATGNAIPTANAGADYTIPKGTPFMLTGSSTDANGDPLTYCWEQMNSGSPSTTMLSVNATSGAAFRSYAPSTNPRRYFPRLSTIQAGATSWTWEAVPNVARSMSFRFTVRDNHAGGQANNSDDMVVTVNGTAGPFAVTAPNTAVSWTAGTAQTVTWNVSGTTANGVNAANVDILLSTDGGNTYPVTILAATPNDGTQSITVPNNPGTQNRIMVKGSGHIFFDISNANFTIVAGSPDTQAPTTPANLAASGTTSSSTNLSWTASTDNVGVTGYDVYRNGSYLATSATTSYNATGLTASTAYSFYVIAKDAAGNSSSASNTVNVTTLAAPITYCTSQGNSIADEQIGRVQFGTINNPSSGGTGYQNFTAISANVTKGSAYAITITPTWTSTVYSEGYAVFIDYNQDGDFADAGETAWTKATSTATPATGSITIPATANTGSTRMRVSMKYNGIPTACETFSYGQVEDYTLNIQAAAPDVTPPSAPTNLTASGTTTTSTNLSWTASTDNVGVTGYDVYQGITFKATVATTSYGVTGLSPATAYSFTIYARDAAGNISSVSNTANVTTLSSLAYCASQGNSVADELIGRVQFGTINNPSTGGTGYTNFTTISTNVTRGSAYTITVTPTWTGTVYPEGYAVFIDYNQDGDFTDAGETAWTKAASTTTPATGSITIPATAMLGSTRMRVSMKYNGIPTACETFSYGQVEDYTLNITSVRIGSTASSAALHLYPNPVSGTEVTVVDVADNSVYTIVNMVGITVATGKTINNKVNVADLASGIYLIEIINDGIKLNTKFAKD